MDYSLKAKLACCIISLSFVSSSRSKLCFRTLGEKFSSLMMRYGTNMAEWWPQEMMFLHSSMWIGNSAYLIHISSTLPTFELLVSLPRDRKDRKWLTQSVRDSEALYVMEPWLLEEFLSHCLRIPLD